MCVICVKPTKVSFPSKEVLERCFDNNPDGAGFMYASNKKVEIRKGFASFDDFWKALTNARTKTGDNVPYVMHFRISTQGAELTNTHPFPLTNKFEPMRKMKSACSIGIAHNGILKLTSDGAKNYSDTMLFIKDYLSLIIRSYSWFKDERNTKLVERLIPNNRLAILDKYGHIELMGEGWIKDGKLYYSNDSYKTEPWWNKRGGDYYYFDDGYYWKPAKKSQAPAVVTTQTAKVSDPYWEEFKSKGQYEFFPDYCPYSEEDNDSYCTSCSNKKQCPYVQAALAE